MIARLSLTMRHGAARLAERYVRKNRRKTDPRPKAAAIIMRSIAIVNPKGGSGKTTLATNLASYYASRQYATVLLDYDSQGSSTCWHSLREASLSQIHAVAAYKTPARTTRSWHMRIPPSTERVIIDTPAALAGLPREDILQSADVVLVPVLPSPIDVHAVSSFIRSLRLDDRGTLGRLPRMGIIVNRVRNDAEGWKALGPTLGALGVPIVAVLRESQGYLNLAERGMGIHDDAAHGTGDDREQWAPLLTWLEQGFDSDDGPLSAKRFL